ncbi:MAG: hypothetical protein FJ090_11435 [Deltaproteobacteria bacterium]|nr:hypothetical protein [Deltaproteobacteria bacterium]
MREIRTCPVTGATVVLNEGWPERPLPARESTECWACGDWGPAIATRYTARSLPHPVPALGLEGNAAPVPGLAMRRDAVGAHELILGPHGEGQADALCLAAERAVDLRRDQRLRGFALGQRATPLGHGAWQLIAFPFDLPPSASARWRDAELADGSRVIHVGEATVALAAWAPRAAFETWILPRQGTASFVATSTHEETATVLASVLDGLWRQLGGPAIDITLEDGEPWRLVLRARLEQPGLLPALGYPLVGVFPEFAARALRA